MFRINFSHDQEYPGQNLKKNTENSIEVTTLFDTWQYLLTPRTRGAGDSLTQL